MKLISKPGKHEKLRTEESGSALRELISEKAASVGKAAKDAVKKPDTVKPETKKAPATKKTEAPAKNVTETPAVPKKPAAHTKSVAQKKPAAAEMPAEPKKPVTAKKTAEPKKPEVSEKISAEAKSEAAKKAAADDIELSFDDEWSNIFAKTKKKKDPQTEEDQKASKPKKEKEESPDKDKEKKAEEELAEGETSRRAKKKAKKKARKEAKKKRSPIKKFLKFLLILAILAGLYLFFVFTNIPFIANARDAYIETAMSTMSHQWMAEWFFPDSVIDKVVSRVEAAQEAQIGIESDWSKKKNTKNDKKQSSDEEAFYDLFWEIDRDTLEDYISDHPDVLDDGWDNLYINEAGIDDRGTSIWTTMDEQVLAIDAANKVLLLRVDGSGYKGVLAVAKDSSRLSCTPAQNVGAYGEELESIMKRTGAVLGMTGSGFIDENGNGNGGSIVGFARCEGQDFGARVGGSYKRIELREDNLLYIVDSSREVDAATTDAVEFAPALVVNGEALIDQLSGYTSINPRACIGQSEKGEVLMLIIEGRMPSRSYGCGLPECTEIFMRHNAYQAMNLDGGTSAIMWFRGEYVIKCSNTAISCRTLPNAWIYS